MLHNSLYAEHYSFIISSNDNRNLIISFIIIMNVLISITLICQHRSLNMILVLKNHPLNCFITFPFLHFPFFHLFFAISIYTFLNYVEIMFWSGRAEVLFYGWRKPLSSESLSTDFFFSLSLCMCVFRTRRILICIITNNYLSTQGWTCCQNI